MVAVAVQPRRAVEAEVELLSEAGVVDGAVRPSLLPTALERRKRLSSPSPRRSHLHGILKTRKPLSRSFRLVLLKPLLHHKLLLRPRLGRACCASRLSRNLPRSPRKLLQCTLLNLLNYLSPNLPKLKPLPKRTR